MSNEIILTISQHGYLAVFLLVFLQDVGVPNPIPNELLMIASGYLAYTAVFSFPLIVLSVFVADLAASAIVYAAFYFFGQIIMTRKPRWIKFPDAQMNRIKLRVESSGLSGIFVGRLTPFIRGYVSVLCGLILLPAKKYSLILVSTALLWAFSYISIGYLIGPYWNLITNNNNDIQQYIGFFSISMIVVGVLFFVAKRFLARTH